METVQRWWFEADAWATPMPSASSWPGSSATGVKGAPQNGLAGRRSERSTVCDAAVLVDPIEYLRHPGEATADTGYRARCIRPASRRTLPGLRQPSSPTRKSCDRLGVIK